MTRSALLISALCLAGACAQAQTNKNAGPVYADAQGVLRYTDTRQEAAFFGVNYTTPFAYAYRAQKALHKNLEEAIRQDVYHMARLGLDAFRVHVWDTEISDTLGNLLENEHLRLFDYLVAELEKRNIRIIITPIAFWGNGYPERDENTPGFSHKYGKGRATVDEAAIHAQENYIGQLFRHVNPYTKQTYGADHGIIAAELNNEPNHSGPKAGVTSYVNRLAAALRGTGWMKPVYYNISESPTYADAVAKANIDGVSFQWYPTGLVANQEARGNYLPNVDAYTIPFDTIPEYRTKTKMVYEFDAADLLQSCMYPAMARSFRGAGFQWATQFAYDPLALAYANTEYQTHYLNLAYTPAKAISLMIAAKAFHRLPRLKNYGRYPADSSFDAFRVSYKEDLSEMNTEAEFYYSRSTTTRPLNATKLQHLAGTGSSPLVHYAGSGAYFLDRLDDGVWRLEVMPDAVSIRDPFERASPQKEVTRIEWKNNPIDILLSDLGAGFSFRALNEGNNRSGTATAQGFDIYPGTYLLERKGKTFKTERGRAGVIGLDEFVAPQSTSAEAYVRHEPYAEVSANEPFTIFAKVVGVDSGKVTLFINRLGGQYRNIGMTRTGANDYSAEVPADIVQPGLMEYRIVVQQGNAYTVFPGNHKGDPFAWDNYTVETWKTFVAAPGGRLELFNPTTDRNARAYPPFRRGFQTAYTTGTQPGQLILQQSAADLSTARFMGFQYVFTGKLRGRAGLDSLDRLVVRARTNEGSAKAKVLLTNNLGQSFSTLITLASSMEDIEVSLQNLVPDSGLIMPRPYPGFLPLQFAGGGVPASFRITDFEKIEITIGPGATGEAQKKSWSLEVESIYLDKKTNNP